MRDAATKKKKHSTSEYSGTSHENIDIPDFFSEYSIIQPSNLRIFQINSPIMSNIPPCPIGVFSTGFLFGLGDSPKKIIHFHLFSSDLPIF